MLRYAGIRLVLSLPTLIAVAVVIFFALRILPGDIVEVKMASDGASITQEMIELERKRLGLDQPIVVQFANWMTGLVTLDLGTSMWTGRDVFDEIAPRLPPTLQVALLATLLAVVIGIPVGAVSAIFPNSLLDHALRVVTLAGLTLPVFWVGMLIVMGLLYAFRWLPPITHIPFHEDPIGNLSQIFWPALTIGLRYGAILARMVRSSMMEIMTEDYIRTARAKGLYERTVIIRHGLRNALLPAVTLVGLEAGFLIGGLVVTEQVFNINGLGRLLVQAASHNDFVLIQAIVMLVAVGFILVNIVVDLVYASLDPRIRYAQ